MYMVILSLGLIALAIKGTERCALETGFEVFLVFSATDILTYATKESLTRYGKSAGSNLLNSSLTVYPF